LVLIWGFVIQLSSSLSGFHQGLTKTKMHSNLEKSMAQPNKLLRIVHIIFATSLPNALFLVFFQNFDADAHQTSFPSALFFSPLPSITLSLHVFVDFLASCHPASFLLLNNNKLSLVFSFHFVMILISPSFYHFQINKKTTRTHTHFPY